jgi:hypothetical protein
MYKVTILVNGQFDKGDNAEIYFNTLASAVFFSEMVMNSGYAVEMEKEIEE